MVIFHSYGTVCQRVNNPLLVGGFNHLEKYESKWEGLSHILENKKYLNQ
jgi:hypothetical protein